METNVAPAMSWNSINDLDMCVIVISQRIFLIDTFHFILACIEDVNAGIKK